MDAIALLKDDHAKVKKMLSALEETTERAVKTRQEGLGELKRELQVMKENLEHHIEEEEGEMFIGEVQEIGIIEPLVVPEPVPPERETEQPIPRRIEEPEPAG